jgi:hypothetical protein
MTNQIQIYFAFALVVIFGILVLVAISRRRQKLPKRDMDFIISQWKEINSRVSLDPKHSLIEADKLVDFTLKKKGYTGSFGDKLKTAEKAFSNIDAIWAAHKLRNNLVHQVGFTVNEGQVRGALFAFKKALSDLGVKI